MDNESLSGEASSSTSKSRTTRKCPPRQFRDSYAAHTRRCFTASTPPEQPPFEYRYNNVEQPHLAQDIRMQTETGWPVTPQQHATPNQLPWFHFWAHCYPTIAALMDTKMYLANERCLQDLLAAILSSAVLFVGNTSIKLVGEGHLDGGGYKGNGDFVFRDDARGVFLLLETKNTGEPFYQSAKQLWKQMIAAWHMNEARVVGDIFGILQDQEGAVAFKLRMERSTADTGAGHVKCTGRITGTPYMAIFSSDSRPASGIAFWTTLLLNTLEPSCASWSAEDCDARVASLIRHRAENKTRFMQYVTNSL